MHDRKWGKECGMDDLCHTSGTPGMIPRILRLHIQVVSATCLHQFPCLVHQLDSQWMMDLEEGSGTEDNDTELLEKALMTEIPEQHTSSPVKMPVSSPGGKCWFGIDLKTFEISIEDHKGKVRGKICERGPKFSSWIRFGGKGLSLLLEGVELVCGLKERTPFRKFWSEGDRVYGLELRCNRAGRFLFCVVRDAENKRFSLAFPEGRGLVGGWKMLASKLRSVGVAPLQWREIEKETLDRNEELLRRCLVGSWEGDADRLLDPVSFGSWAKNSWFLEGNLWLSNVRENLMLLEFEFEDEAERVFSSGARRFRGRSFRLEKWKPSVGCLKGVNEEARHVWVRILGLPLHLWGRSLFKQFGDSCGRYVAVDENTTERRNLKWARVLVETSGWQHPSSLQVVAGASCYALQLWWEEEPPSSVILQPEKLPSPTLGTGAPTTDMMGEAAPSSPARAMEKGQYPLSQARVEESGQLLDVLGHSSLTCGRPFGPRLGKAQVSMGSSLKPLGPAPSKALGQEIPSCSLRRSGAPSVTPSFSRTPQKVASPLLDAPTASLPVEASKTHQMEASQFDPVGSVAPCGSADICKGASPPVEARNKKGMPSLPPISLRGDSSSSSSPFWDTGLERGKEFGSSPLFPMARDVEVTPNPLSIMLRDGSTVILSTAPTSDLGNNMAKQRDSLDYPRVKKDGHEVEILELLSKLKLRTGSNSLRKRRKKKKSCSTRFERELKRLECSVSYKGTSGISKRSGLNDCDKRKLIKGVVRNQKADLVCLLETKVKNVSTQLVNSVGVGRFLNWASVDARGTAGGLLLIWDNRVLENLEVESGGYSISARFRNCSDGFSWIFSGVYGPVIGSEKEDFWEELGAIRGLWEDPWCIGGDFNAVRYLEERRNAPRLTADMRRFSEVIGELGLRDIPLAGGPFTWIGGLNSQVASRLDRFLISDQWEDRFSAISQSALPRLVSDHNPIILEAGGFSSGKSPFRFENMWLKIDGFKDLVKSWWNGYSVEGYSSHCITEKFKALKKDLKKWNKEVVGNVSFNRAEALSRLQQWEAKENENALTPEDIEAKNLDLEEYKKWALLEETSWRQKSREIWLREGDKNTKYFHKMANARARRNFLSKIKVNGVNLSSLAEIKEGVCNAYQTLLSDPGDWRPNINGLTFKELGEGLASSLEVMFSEEEIFASLSSFCGDKAPGGAEDLKDFRPISLVGSVYKLLAKVLANRLKTVIGEVISDSQHAFVHGRQIFDAVLLANEALDSRLKDNIPGLLLKMDIEKAFDHVNWNFLMEVMSKMGFGHRWINWIKWCCSTASFSILINGSPSGFFRSSRGLRQGDPLSPYLFLLAMEALSQLLSRARNGNFISGFRVGGRGSEGLVVSHLLFADDTLIFCDADVDQLQYLSWTFMWFEAISGLKVNLNKTEAIPVGEGIPMETLVAVLGCKIGSLPTSYLGLPLGAPYKSIRVWDAVEERFRKRLSLWKRQYLSKGGRLTLLKSTLSSLPTYFLSLFVIPKRVCARLEKIQRDFLWGGGALEKKPHLVSWKVVCADKKKGGLGIRSLATFNKALLGKWLWRFANENEPLWKHIILSKYDLQEGGWCSKDGRNRYGVGFWKAIRKGWENFRSHSRFIIGDGTRVKFWKDLWCGNQSLEEAFPILFNLSVNKEGWVAEAWEEDEGGGVEDLFRWKENKNGTFSVKSFYSSFSRDSKPLFPARTIWMPWVPIRDVMGFEVAELPCFVTILVTSAPHLSHHVLTEHYSCIPHKMSRNRWSSIVYRRGQKQLTRLFLKEAEHALQLSLSEGN
ncbi:Transposon TX1 uncharacterized 149 kDa protein [Vitis vinifera]|uniref:Transposon TX1 uncharacterized 149 kDa protein n=1 Tax=Vitis vinifera TaxID=29760 RepID=A0A438EJ68_VITVI|nr:Transposon TX1 uncharacterized 149 kDa protein [Vitis vinifera]